MKDGFRIFELAGLEPGKEDKQRIFHGNAAELYGGG